LFNQRDWDGLRALLTDNVKLHQSLHPLRVGRADVGLFSRLYAKIDEVSVAQAWLEGREVIAVLEDRDDPKPSYIMWLEWRDGRISFIHDYRYVRYVTADAELTLAPEAKPADDGRPSVMRGAVHVDQRARPWPQTGAFGGPARREVGRSAAHERAYSRGALRPSATSLDASAILPRNSRNA
jgi:hypothetical protein